MRFTFLKHGIIFSLSLFLGFLGLIQYKSVFHEENLFEEQNPFRELRLMFESNQTMKSTIAELQEKLQNLSSRAAIQESALKNIENANAFSGQHMNKKDSIEVLIEGNVTLRNLIEISNVFWNAGVENIQLNGISINNEQAGFDQAGGQILLGSTPLNAPYLFTLYGTPSTLSKILSPETGALKRFQTAERKITLSLSTQ